MQENPTSSRQNSLFLLSASSLVFLAGLFFYPNTASAHPTLMFRFPFDAAHSSATGTTSLATGLLPAGSIVLNTLLSPGATITTTTPADLRGGPNSGVQNVGESINFTNSSGANDSPAVGAYLTNSASLGLMGDGVTPGSTFSNFTPTIWINQSASPTAATDTGGPDYFMVGHLTTIASFSAGSADSIAFRAAVAWLLATPAPVLTSGVRGNTITLKSDSRRDIAGSLRCDRALVKPIHFRHIKQKYESARAFLPRETVIDW